MDKEKEMPKKGKVLPFKSRKPPIKQTPTPKRPGHSRDDT